MRVLYATDLHGSTRHYRQAYLAALREQTDMVLLGGDLCPDLPPARQGEWVRDAFAAWLAGFHQAGGGPVAGITGNHDTAAAGAALAQLPAFRLLDREVATQGRWDLAGFDLTPPSPWALKDRERRDLAADPPPAMCAQVWITGPGGEAVAVDEAEYFRRQPALAEELAGFVLPQPGRTVLLCHSPPAGGPLDWLHSGLHCGSAALLAYLAQQQPLLALHGHVHEAPRLSGRCGQPVGRTLCINPGQDEQTPVWAVFSLDDVPGTWRHSAGLSL